MVKEYIVIIRCGDGKILNFIDFVVVEIPEKRNFMKKEEEKKVLSKKKRVCNCLFELVIYAAIFLYAAGLYQDIYFREL